jgi:C_GCAxxG_C_C family probable redox protein
MAPSTSPMPAEEAARAKEESLARFADEGPGHINCAQAVLSFALRVDGMDPELITAARYFGGGVAGIGEVCGALSGAALALGLRDHEVERSPVGGQADTQRSPDPSATRVALQDLMRAFNTEFGSLRCRDLTGCDLTTPEGHDAFLKSGGNQRCPLFVSWACDRLLPLLDAEAS